MRNTIASLTLAFAFGLSVAPTAQAQFFRDDFEDGSATDSSPVTWSRYPAPYDSGVFAVTNGDLVITPSITGPEPNPNPPVYREMDVVVADRFFHDVNVHTRVRALTNDPSVVGIGLLDTHFTDGRVGMAVNAFLVFDGSRRYVGMNREVNQNFTSMGEVNTPISHFAGDVNLRFRVTGNEVRFSVWPDGSPEPAVPQLVSRSLPASFDNIQGRVVVFAGVSNAVTPVAFRFVNVVPEPSTARLAVAVLLSTVVFTKRRCTVR